MSPFAGLGLEDYKKKKGGGRGKTAATKQKKRKLETEGRKNRKKAHPASHNPRQECNSWASLCHTVVAAVAVTI